MKRVMHGMYYTRAYRAWSRMKQRCYNPDTLNFKNWGGRSITVCRRWRRSFLAFFRDMGPCPPGRSLDRKNNDKGYTPGNCKWSTPSEQGLNRRSTTRLTAFGRTQALKQWAEEFEMKRLTLLMRVKRGWPLKAALTTPLRPLGAR